MAIGCGPGLGDHLHGYSAELRGANSRVRSGMAMSRCSGFELTRRVSHCQAISLRSTVRHVRSRTKSCVPEAPHAQCHAVSRNVR